MQFSSLGSGSRGNATLIRAGDTCVLVDCGFSAQETERRLQRLGTCAEDLAGILVTHEHADHISGVARVARKFGLTVWMTAGTRRAWKDGQGVECEVFNPHQQLQIGHLKVEPFPVPHDALEPCQYVFHAGDRKLGVISDAGAVTPFMARVLSHCDSLMLECNHDVTMLQNGPYPPSLKTRVGGGLGHLNNEQAASLLDHQDWGRLQHVVLTHLSDKNNTPELARQACAQRSGREPDWFGVADQDAGFDWREVS